MKHLILSIACAFCLFASADVFAQAINNTGDTWTISFYGATTVVAGNNIPVPVNVGTDCAAGISVTNQLGCTHTFPVTGDWIPGDCSDRTKIVLFGSQINPNPISGCHYYDPEFSFFY